MEAYAILMIAELFCSGSRSRPCRLLVSRPPTGGLHHGRNVRARRGVVRHGAHAECDSSNWVYLAQVGKARALLGAATRRKAAHTVQGVPTNFTHLSRLMRRWQRLAEPVWRDGARYLRKDSEGDEWPGLVHRTPVRRRRDSGPVVRRNVIPAKYMKTAAGVLDRTQAIRDNPIWLWRAVGGAADRGRGRFSRRGAPRGWHPQHAAGNVQSARRRARPCPADGRLAPALADPRTPPRA